MGSRTSGGVVGGWAHDEQGADRACLHAIAGQDTADAWHMRGVHGRWRNVSVNPHELGLCSVGWLAHSMDVGPGKDVGSKPPDVLLQLFSATQGDVVKACVFQLLLDEQGFLLIVMALFAP